MSESPKKRKAGEESTDVDESKPAPRKREITHFIAIDVEATGPNVVKNYMPEMGASFWAVGDSEPLATFYVAIEQPPGTDWDEKTKQEYWLNPAKGKDGKTQMALLEARLIRQPLSSPEKAMRDFHRFATLAQEMLGPDDTVIVISDTAEFDTAYANVYLGRHCPELCPNLNLLFGQYRSTRDIDAFYYGLGQRLQKWGAEEVALGSFDEKEFPAWVQRYEATHDPLDDAISIGARASYLLSLCE